MDGKRNVVLFTAAFFLLAFVLLGCTLGMQLSLRAELDALPAAQVMKKEKSGRGVRPCGKSARQETARRGEEAAGPLSKEGGGATWA